jgi:hypothetical protein
MRRIPAFCSRLAAAINALCAGIRTRWLAILGLVLGNDLVIIIECLVVGIQTIRLVLVAEARAQLGRLRPPRGTDA